MPKIFISYRRADSAMLATHLAVMLKSSDIDAFVDTRSIDGGGPFPNRLHRAIEECDVFVCLLGATTLESEWVRKEIEHAHNIGKVLIPVFQERYLAPSPIPDDHIDALLQSDGVHILDVRNLYIEAAIASLAEMIHKTSLSIVPSALIPANPKSTEGALQEISRVSDSARLTETASVVKIPDLSDLTAAVLKILPLPFDWCFVPSGNVTLETDSPKSYTIPDFAIAKYTVTNAQFQVFVDAKDGYRAEKEFRWFDFSEDARNYRLQNLKPKPTTYEGNNLPRTNISWFDAVAFTRWLTSKIHALPVVTAYMPSALEITLPTEQQWQRAAIGDTGWAYPWGNDFDSACLCYAGNSKTRPVLVTDYENGASPYGVVQMSGNIWEWCLNNIKNSDDARIESGASFRVLRGGSWNGDQNYSRAIFRHNGISNYIGTDIGFRVVLHTPL